MWDDYIVKNNIPHRKLNFPDDHPSYNPNTIKTTYEIIDNHKIKLINDNFKNKKVFIDKKDYDKIKYYSWSVSKRGYVIGYVNGKDTRLHRYLMDVNDSKIYVDHIDNNRSNNTRSNLRISDATKNARNKIKRKNTASKYFGLHLDKLKGWSSNVCFNGKRKYVDRDMIEINAARRRDLYILDNHPNEHYKLNFVWTDKDIYKWKKILKTPYQKKYSDQIMDISKKSMIALLDNDLDKIDELNKLSVKKRRAFDKKYSDKIMDIAKKSMIALLDNDLDKIDGLNKSFTKKRKTFNKK